MIRIICKKEKGKFNGTRQPSLNGVNDCVLLLILLEELHVLPIPLFHQVLPGNEPERRRIHAVTQARWFGAVIEYMADVRVGVFAPDLGPDREPAPVLFLHDIAGLEGLGETRPSRAGIVFVEGTEQGLAGDDIDVDARFLVVPVFVIEGRLRAVLLRYFVLHGSQPFFRDWRNYFNGKNS